MTAMELVENDPIDSAPPVEVELVPPKPKYKVENPKPTVMKDSKEFPGLKEIGEKEPMVEWKIVANPEKFKESIIEATKMTVELTQSAEDVQSIYRVNKTVYEDFKKEYPTEFAELLDLFKAKKESFK